MSWDFGQFFSDAGAKAQEALDQMVKVGVPAVEVAAAQWGQDLLKNMQGESQKELNAAVKDLQNSPSSPLGSAITATVQGTFLQTYGMHIAIGVGALIVLGFALRGK